MDGEIGPQDQQTEMVPMLDRGDETSEVIQDLNMFGFRDEVTEWLINANVDIMPKVNGARGAARVDGKGQQVVQARTSEA